MNAEIIAVGSEMLGVSKLDTNSLYLTAELNRLGVEVVAKAVIGDDRNRLAEAVRRALSRSEIVIISGGLGPTEDDVTREAVAVALDRKLSFSDEIAGWLEQRKQGFTEQLKAKYPGLKLVADKYADGQATTGLNIATDLITANPNLKGIFASNLIMAQGVGQAIAENNLAGKVGLIGFDSDEKLIKFLNDGVISGLVVQDPYRMGYDGIKTALAASKGEKVEANVDTGANLVTKANMKDPKIDALLNPKL